MRSTLYILVVVLGLVPCLAGAQVKPRVVGLGGNAEYMQLLERELELSLRADSLEGAVTRLREEFRTNPGDRRAFAERILALENEALEIGNLAGSVAVRVREIEEAFILDNLQNAEAGDEGAEAGIGASDEQSADFVRNGIFRRLLPGEDYAALLRAQAGEGTAVALLMRYLENYGTIAALAKEYAAVDNAVAADSIFTSYIALEKNNADVADSLGVAWRRVFDNKLFAYNYLLQTQNRPQLLAMMESAERDTRDEIARRRPVSASEEVVAYFEQKALMFEYETAIAQMFGLGAAADSLRRAADVLERLERPMPEGKIEERLFIEYAGIAVHNPPVYNAANPIPEVEVYRRGVVYRIMLNSYTVRQAVSLFKGLAPLAYRQEDGRWIYYAGGFADFDSSETALGDMKKRGFRNAKIVVWHDGQALVLDEKPTEGVSWRVEIDSTQLTDEIRVAISEANSGADISRSGDTFIVGPFQTPFEAEKVAGAIRKADPAVTVRTIDN